MYTANIVDTVIFRSLGKPPGPRWRALKHAVETVGTELWAPATVYRELADFGTDPPTNPYLDHGIEAGWIHVATPLPGCRNEAFDTAVGPAEQAQHLGLGPQLYSKADDSPLNPTFKYDAGIVTV